MLQIWPLEFVFYGPCRHLEDSRHLIQDFILIPYKAIIAAPGFYLFIPTIAGHHSSASRKDQIWDFFGDMTTWIVFLDVE
jgi:hypothetical protein